MDRYLLLSGTDGALTLACLVLALLLAAAGHRRRMTAAVLGGFLSCAGAKTVIALVVLANFGRLFAAAKLIVECPVVLAPAIALAVKAGPYRVALVSATVTGAAADVWFAYFAPPQPPYVATLVFVTGLCLVTALASTLVPRWIAAVGRKDARLRVGAVIVLGVLPVLAGIVYSMRGSALPASYGMSGHGIAHQVSGGTSSVDDLAGPAGPPDVRFTLTAAKTRLRTGGLDQDALTFNGTAPGPLLRVREGQLVEVTLINKDVDAGVTVHWHGLNVPNAEDGVAGVTQDAVRPGRQRAYRFRPEQTGTFWYHSHQDSQAEVEQGLYGVLIVDPPEPEPPTLDVAAVAHSWPDVNTINTSTVDHQRAAPGRLVRVRLVDTDSWPVRFAVTGAPFRVAGIDGAAVHEPGELSGRGLPIPAGGRLDVLFAMPAGPVTITAFADARHRKAAARGIADASMVFSADGLAEPATVTEPGTDVDFSGYGTPAPTPFDASSAFAERATYYFDDTYRFYDGSLRPTYSLNGELFPDTPMLMVHEGDLVELTFVNRSGDDHAMHLHGHTMLVLSRNGKTVAGSPWWTDTLNVAPGEVYTVAVKADNPGVWMDHCHNFVHAAGGMMTHLAYYGVTDPYRAGSATGNSPE